MAGGNGVKGGRGTVTGEPGAQALDGLDRAAEDRGQDRLEVDQAGRDLRQVRQGGKGNAHRPSLFLARLYMEVCAWAEPRAAPSAAARAPTWSA